MAKRKLKQAGPGHVYTTYKDYTREEVMYIVMEFTTTKSTGDFYRKFCEKFGTHRSKASLLSKARKLTTGFFPPNYYTINEIVKMFETTRKTVLWQAKKRNVPIVIIRRSQCIREDHTQELFMYLAYLKNPKMYTYEGFVHIVDAANLIGVHRVDLHYARRMGFIEMTKMPDITKSGRRSRGGMANYIRVETVDYIVSKMRETGETQVKWRKWFKKNPKN